MDQINVALVLLATKHEYYQGQVDTCLTNYIDVCPPGVNVDIIVCMNTHVDNELSKYSNNQHVNSVTVHDCDIPGEQDVYIQNNKQPEIKQELGQSNGPNQLFYRSFEHLKTKSYDYYMVIECDTRPVIDNWMPRLQHYCQENDFIIAGSRYKGKQKLPDKDWTGHLNGVAIYKNCDMLHETLSGSRELLNHYIHVKHYVMLNYDIAIWYYVNQSGFDKYLNMLIDTNIISNYSLPCDKSTDTQTILSQQPDTIILHQKQ